MYDAWNFNARMPQRQRDTALNSLHAEEREVKFEDAIGVQWLGPA